MGLPVGGGTGLDLIFGAYRLDAMSSKGGVQGVVTQAGLGKPRYETSWKIIRHYANRVIVCVPQASDADNICTGRELEQGRKFFARLCNINLTVQGARLVAFLAHLRGPGEQER
jgi:hypothetical protein